MNDDGLLLYMFKKNTHRILVSLLALVSHLYVDTHYRQSSEVHYCALFYYVKKRKIMEMNVDIN